MAISALDLFKIGIGPSSSHTVGPMTAACEFVAQLKLHPDFKKVVRLQCDMYGSLGATGRGHGTPKAVILGLMGERPDSVDVSLAKQKVEAVRERKKITLNGGLRT